MPIVTGVAGVFYIIILIPLLVFKLLASLLPAEFRIVQHALRSLAKVSSHAHPWPDAFSRTEPVPFVSQGSGKPAPAFDRGELNPFIMIEVGPGISELVADEQPPFLTSLNEQEFGYAEREPRPFWESL